MEPPTNDLQRGVDVVDGSSVDGIWPGHCERALRLLGFELVLRSAVVVVVVES